MMVDVLPIGEVKDQAKKIPGILKKGAKKLDRLLPLRPKEKVEEKKNGEVPNVVPNDEEIEMMVDVLPIGEVKDQAKKIPGILKKGAKKLGSKIKNPLRNKKVENKKVESPNPMADDSVVPMSKKNKMMVDVLPIGEVKDQA